MCTMYYSTNGSCGCGGYASFWNGSFQRTCRDGNGNIYVRNGSSCGCNNGCGGRFIGCGSCYQSLSTLSGDAYYERLYGLSVGCGCNCGCGSIT